MKAKVSYTNKYLKTNHTLLKDFETSFTNVDLKKYKRFKIFIHIYQHDH